MKGVREGRQDPDIPYSRICVCLFEHVSENSHKSKKYMIWIKKSLLFLFLFRKPRGRARAGCTTGPRSGCLVRRRTFDHDEDHANERASSYTYYTVTTTLNLSPTFRMEGPLLTKSCFEMYRRYAKAEKLYDKTSFNKREKVFLLLIFFSPTQFVHFVCMHQR